jgi:hypothetical protein
MATRWLVAASALALACAVVVSQERPPATPPGARGQDTTSTRPESESQIETWVRHAAPGKEHKLLEHMLGRWETVTTYRQEASSPPVQARGRCERKWVLDGRFVQEELDGGLLGMPFRGVGAYGYDAFERKYTSVWMDTTSTAITTYLGVYDEEKKLVNFTGLYGDPWTGEKKKVRGVTRLESPEQEVLELYLPKPDGGEFKMLEIVYHREKGQKSGTPKS